MKRLQALLDVIKIIRDLNVLDCNVMITDAEAKILRYVDGKTFSTSTQIGATAPGGLVKGCIERREVTRGIIPARLYGVTLKAICHPIIEEDGTLSGVIGTATSLKVQEQLHGAAQSWRRPRRRWRRRPTSWRRPPSYWPATLARQKSRVSWYSVKSTKPAAY